MEKMIKISEGVRQFLTQTDIITSSDNPYIKKNISNLFLIGDKGSGVTEFTEAYEQILKRNHVYPVRGNNATYLKLLFPKYGSDQDYERFFHSPENLVLTQNDFYGVFVISFQEWTGKDLLEDSHFNELMKYVDYHKNDIHFIFHVTSSFSAKEEFQNELRHHVNLTKVELKAPDLDQAVKYIQEYLKENDIVLNVKAKNALKKMIDRKINMSSSSYYGYKTLKQFAQNLQYELYMDTYLEGENNKKAGHVSAETIYRIEDKVFSPTEDKETNRKIGFC